MSKPIIHTPGDSVVILRPDLLTVGVYVRSGPLGHLVVCPDDSITSGYVIGWHKPADVLPRDLAQLAITRLEIAAQGVGVRAVPGLHRERGGFVTPGR